MEILYKIKFIMNSPTILLTPISKTNLIVNHFNYQDFIDL